MKKLLSVLFVGLFTAVWSFASADTYNGFTSDSTIYHTSCTSDYVCWDDFYWDEYPIAYFSQFYRCIVVWDNFDCEFFSHFDTSPYASFGLDVDSSYEVLISESEITVIDNWGSNSDSLLNPWVISSWVQNWVSAFTGWFWNLLPTLILFWLYIAVIYWGWDIIRSRLKHIFVVDKPSIDDVTNCQLRLDENWNPVHQIDLNWKEYVYVEWFDRYIEKDDKFASYVNENLDFDYKAYAKDHYDEFRSVNTENSPYYRGWEYDENTAYRDFMHFEYQAWIDYDEAVHNWNSDNKKWLSYFDRVDRAYYDYKYSREYDD